MTDSQELRDFSAYKRPPFRTRFGVDETYDRKFDECELADVLGNTLPLLESWAELATTDTVDYSVLGGDKPHPNFATQLPIASPNAPLPFVDAHDEMLSNKDLEDGWDDISSTRISSSAVDVALKLLALLPYDLTPPAASASGDGTVDWYWRNGRHAATVTFYPSGRVAYFSMTDVGIVKDSFKFSGSIPAELVESLQQF